MSEYAKALGPVVVGLALIVLGFVFDDEWAIQVGIGAIGVSPLVAAVPNRPRRQ